MDVNRAELQAKYIEPDPYHPGAADVRIVGCGVHVWALIGYLKAIVGDAGIAEAFERELHAPLGPMKELAVEFGVPVDAVLAAVAYYRDHPQVIDARIAANVISAA